MKFFQINEAFHVKLLEIADNRYRIQMVAEHAAIIAALKKLDEAEAQPAMRAHIESGQAAAG